MKKNFWTVWVPPTKEQLERNMKYYKKQLEKLNDPEYVKKMVEDMKKDLQDNIKECENDLLIYGKEEEE